MASNPAPTIQCANQMQALSSRRKRPRRRGIKPGKLCRFRRAPIRQGQGQRGQVRFQYLWSRKGWETACFHFIPEPITNTRAKAPSTPSPLVYGGDGCTLCHQACKAYSGVKSRHPVKT